MKRIYIKNNYLIIAENSDLSDDKRNLLSNVYVEKNNTLFIFFKRTDDTIIQSILFSNILNRYGSAYPDIETFTDLIEKSTGDGNISVENLALTSFGEVLVGQLTPQFQGSFEYTVLNTELNTNTVTNGGTVTQGSAMAVISTSTTTASDAEMKTTTHAKYNAGLGGVVRFTSLFTTGIAETKQMAGLVDEKGSSTPYKNGYMIGFNGVNFNVHIHQNDSMTSIIQSDFDDRLDGNGLSGMVIDPTKLNVFEIRFQYLGGGAIEFCVEDERTGMFIVFHKVLYTNKNILPSVFNPNFHFTIYAENTSTTSDMIVKCASYAYFIEGKSNLSHLHQPQFDSEEIVKTSVTTEIALMTLRNKATYVSKTNFVDIILELVHVSIEASSPNNLGSVRIVKDATIGGTPSFSDINTTDSVMEIDTAGTTITGGKTLFSFPLAGKNDKEILDLLKFKMILSSNEKITVAGSSANSATMKCGFLWKELF